MTITNAPTTQPPVSLLRAGAYALHLCVAAWTFFCGVNVLIGLIRSGPMTSNAEAVGAALGIGVWAIIWFIPIVGAELIAIALTVAAKEQSSTKMDMIYAAAFAAIPILALMAFLAIGVFSTFDYRPEGAPRSLR